MSETPFHASVRHVRVFISSPSDVPVERRLARAVVERLGKDPVFRDHLKLDPILYDDPDASTPMLANLTAQESVNRGLFRPSECEIVVCIFWGRMGTPLAKPLKRDKTPYLSGTEWEFEDARRAKRDILLYGCRAKIPTDLDDPEFEAKRAQKRLVDQFFERLKGRGFTTYQTPDEFEKLLESHLRSLLSRSLVTASHVDGDAKQPAIRRKGRKGLTASSLEVPALYRDWLKSETGTLELLGFGGSQGRSLFLSSMYVPLVSSAGEELVGRSIRVGPTGDTTEQAPLLLHALERQSLYVPGAPGCGKSTFCNWVAWLASEGGMPRPDLDPPNQFVETFPQSLAGKLPILVRLREFWQALPVTTSGGTLAPGEFVAVLESWLRDRTTTAAAFNLAAFLDHGSAVMILDGIDEVPTFFAAAGRESNPRQLLLATLASLVRRWTPKGNVVLITGRPYGLTAAEIARLGLRSAPIGDLPGPLQILLARRWFRIQKQDGDKGDRSAEDLTRDIGAREWLQPLAANPLMLTAMCAIYSDGGRLPQDRHQLYDRIVDSVLTKRYSETRRRDRVRFELGAIAHAMHTGEALGSQHFEPMAEATFDEAEMALKGDQSASTQFENVLRPRDAREELLARSGLLTSRGQKQVGFYHLSIQEFLAAERIFELRFDTLKEVFMKHSISPNWRNTLAFLFGRYMAAFSVATRPLALLRELVDNASPDSLGLQLVLADCAEMLGAKGYPLDESSRDRLLELLLGSMTLRASGKKRCDAGSSLGRMGDPRFEPAHWFLPRQSEAPLGFLRVGAGPFVMGSNPTRDGEAMPHEEPQHNVELAEFYVARYPVTVAQFEAFLRSSGHESHDANGLQAVTPNHPVVRVTWHDALAYCDWLTEKLRQWTDAPPEIRTWVDATIRKGWRAMLPTEAEWEKAARGIDGRIYPWGSAFDPDCLNGYDAGIGGTSAVGAFPRGASPCGALDMSGNVWEWTRSVWRSHAGTREFGYPYRPGDPAREDLGAPDSVPRVLRGGSSNLSNIFVRVALRYRELPNVGQKDFGFRLVISDSRQRTS